MPSQLQKGEVFVDGETVTGARLNNLVDSAIAKPGIISEPPLKATPIAGDGFLLYDSVDPTVLKRAPIGGIAAVHSVGLALPVNEFTITSGTSPVTNTGTLTATWKPQPGNKFFAGNGTGLGTTPTFRLIGAQDLAIASVEIAATTIDWSLGNLFHKNLTVPVGFTFSNTQDGQTIRVILQQDATGGRFFSFPNTVFWADWRFDGGVGSRLPVQWANPNCFDIYEFTCYGTGVAGKASIDYALVP